MDFMDFLWIYIFQENNGNVVLITPPQIAWPLTVAFALTDHLRPTLLLAG